MNERERYEQLQAVYARAVSMNDADAREAYVRNACADDAQMCERVSKMLNQQHPTPIHRALSDTMIEQRRVEMDRTLNQSGNGFIAAESIDAHPQQIGRYRIVRRIASGGMGTVFEAEQDSPKRRVALKMVHAQRSTPALVERLQRESEILGRLQHPGIAQIYDAGMIDLGDGAQPYFAMEYVDGVSLTKYADAHRLNDQERLELLALICDAMQYAHDKGVIHRDLKPDNILVEAEGRPKVLDFGVARITSDSTFDVSTMTRDGQILGTLSYMAPEQMNHGPESVMHHADIYALGVIGFELLAERLPHDVTGMSIAAALKLLLEIDAPRLSTIDAHFKGDVQTIIGKALEREPQCRYESAAAMAADIRRYLSHQPITARPPSAMYKSRKFVRRNRALVGGTAATILVLIAGIIVASMLAAAEGNQRRLATERETLARHNNIKAMRGLYAGGQMLEQRGEIWEAVRQLHVIDKGARKWEWQHLSLRLPWMIDDTPYIRNPTNETIVTAGFANNHELFQYSRGGYMGVHDLLTGRRRPIILPGVVAESTLFWSHAPPNAVAVRTDDQVFGVIDVANETYRVFNHTWQEQVGEVFRLQFNRDTSLAAHWLFNNPRISVFGRNERLFHMDSGLGPGMQWTQAHFLRNRPYVLFVRWGGTVFVVNTDTWEVVAQSNKSIQNHGRFGVSEDETTLYVSSNLGIERWDIPTLEFQAMVVEGLGPLAQLAMPDHGHRAAVTSSERERLYVFDTNTGEQLYNADIGQPSFPLPPVFAPDGRLLRCGSPDEGTPWIVDVDEPQEPAITTLRGHKSWIYQLAISPDGAMLASGAPVGDVLLWDLENGRLLARFERIHNESEDVVAHNMNAPLVFSPAGDSLYFAELDGKMRQTGLTRIDLRTGERRWTPYPSRSAVIDAVAAMMQKGSVSAIYHHAALLADGRIVQGTAYRWSGEGVVIRRPGEKGVPVPNLATGRIDAGVAANPDGSTYATGEYHVMRIRDTETDQILHDLVDGVSDNMWGVAYSNDGSRFAIGTEDGRIIMYETEFYEKLCDVRLPRMEGASRKFVFSMRWTPDDSRLVTCGAGTVIRVLESQRPFQRDHRKNLWNQALERARQALASGRESAPAETVLDRAALRCVHVEQWAAAQETNKRPAVE